MKRTYSTHGVLDMNTKFCREPQSSIPFGRPSTGWESNIKIYLKSILARGTFFFSWLFNSSSKLKVR